jgi:hypothetical protein
LSDHRERERERREKERQKEEEIREAGRPGKRLSGLVKWGVCVAKQQRRSGRATQTSERKVMQVLAP